MEGNAEPPERKDSAPPIATYGKRIEADQGWLEGTEIHEFFHQRKVKLGCTLSAIVGSLILGGLLILTIHSIRESQRGPRALAQADQMLRGEDYAGAIRLYTVALEQSLPPQARAIAYGRRGWARTKIRRDPEAIPDFTAALALQPTLLFAILHRGLTFHRQGKFAEAMADYDRTLALDQNELDAYFNRSTIYAHLGRIDDAIADMSEAIRIKPSDPNLYVGRADFFLQAGKLDAAQASYESALGLDPENAEAYWGLAKVYDRQGDAERGIAKVNEALRKHPESIWLHFARGLICLDRDELELAAEDFDQVILRRPDYGLAYANRGMAELGMGRSESALAYAERAVTLNSRLWFPYYVRGRAYTERSEYNNAIAAFEQAIERTAGSVWSLSWRALAEGYAGDYALSRRDLEETTQRFPGAYEAHLMFGWFLATCPQAAFRDGPAALREAKLAVELSSDEPYALDVLAAAYAEAGDFEEAQATELRALTKLKKTSHDRQRMEKRRAGYRRGQPYRDYP